MSRRDWKACGRRNEQRWKSTFARFVRAYGVDRLARGLNIGPTAIYQWIWGRTAPYPVHAVIIQRLARESGVELTIDEIYRHSFDLRGGEGEAGAPSVYRARHASREGSTSTSVAPRSITASELRLHLVPATPRSSSVSRVKPSIKPEDAPAICLVEERESAEERESPAPSFLDKRDRRELLRTRVRVRDMMLS